MARGKNAQLAVDMYRELHESHQWSAENAWHGIALLLLTCNIWMSKRDGWQPLFDCIVYRESNDLVEKDGKPNAYLRRGYQLTDYVATQLGIDRNQVCSILGSYWRQERIRTLQPHNFVGHAFRSLITEILAIYGNRDVHYEEEVDPIEEFPGHEFRTRSKSPRIDIVARKGTNTVALISTRWRYRHDRVDVLEEAQQYVPPARRNFPNCRYYPVLGEFAPSRLDKVITNAKPLHANAVIEAAVHFEPKLITRGLGENGRMTHLRSLAWLIQETYKW